MRIRKGVFLSVFAVILIAYVGVAYASIAGSSVSVGAPQPIISDTFDLVFTMNLVSIDGEYADRLDIILPAGWTVNVAFPPPPNTSATCPGVEVQASSFDRAVTWEIAGGYSGGSTCGPWGAGMEGMDLHFIVNVTLPNCNGAPWTVPWKIYGDRYGGAAEPHDLTGSLTINSCISTTATANTSYTFTTVTHPDAIADGYGTYLTNINDSGQVVGYYEGAGFKDRGFLYAGGGFTPINYPGADQTRANGINNNGYIVGSYVDVGGNVHGFVYSGTDYITIDYPGAAETKIYDINDNNQVTGSYSDGGFFSPVHGFYADNTGVKQLDYPGLFFTIPMGINTSHGIGGYYLGSSIAMQGFFYKGGTFTSVLYPGASQTQPMGVNNKGTVGGLYINSDGKTHGFLFNGISHYSRIDYPGGEESYVASLNEQGELVGNYVDSSGTVHGYLATKFPWPMFMPAINGKH